jgi:tetratricopeptide (TPR) repeat protein
MKESGQTDKPASGLNKYLPQLLIIGMILLVYIQNLWFDFAYLDDNLIVFAEYEKIDSLSKIPQAFASGYLLDNYYRPMIMISFIIDTAIAGQSSTMYHLTNLIIHIVFSLLLYSLLLKFEIRKIVALFSVIIFAIHPINLNAVSWIAGRNDLIVGLFSIISILSFINYVDTKKAYLLILHLISFVLAMFSKEIGVIIPVSLIIYLYQFNRACFISKKKILKLVLTWGILTVMYLYLRLFVVKIQPQEQIGLYIFLKNFYILSEYFGKFFYLPAIIPLSLKNYDLIYIGLFNLLILFSIIIWGKFYRNKKFIFGVIFFIIFIVPSLMVRLQTKDGSFVYLDCRLYLPLVGLILSFAVIVSNIKVKRLLKLILSISLIVYLLIFSFIKNRPYNNGESFWSEVIKDHPYEPYNYIGMGFYYYDNKEYEKAALYAENAIRINPTIDPEFYHKAALAYESAGDFLKANDVLERSLEIDKDNPVTIVNLVKNYLKLKQTDKADIWSEKFLRLNTDDKKKLESLSSSISYYYTQARQYNSAVKFMKQALEIFPDNPVLNNDLGALYANTDSLDSAKIYFEKAVDLEPDNISFRKNLNFVLSKLK